ncbi:MAG: hypothetical protein NTZ68_04390 [Candidatus Dependentiae bacterium]|nr:hypothetical protein [Candidatus Dependentiae bacterium]
MNFSVKTKNIKKYMLMSLFLFGMNFQIRASWFNCCTEQAPERPEENIVETFNLRLQRDIFLSQKDVLHSQIELTQSLREINDDQRKTAQDQQETRERQQIVLDGQKKAFRTQEEFLSRQAEMSETQSDVQSEIQESQLKVLQSQKDVEAGQKKFLEAYHKEVKERMDSYTFPDCDSLSSGSDSTQGPRVLDTTQLPSAIPELDFTGLSNYRSN